MKCLAAGVILQKNNKYLLVQEQKPKVYGLWNWPAGRINKGETPEDCARREAKEEVGFTVEILEKLGDWPSDYISDGYKALFFGKIVEGELSIKKDELLDARWFSKEEIISLGKENLRSQWVLEALVKLQ